MFSFFRRKRIAKMQAWAQTYVISNYVEEKKPEDASVRYSHRNQDTNSDNGGIKYSIKYSKRGETNERDLYNASSVSGLMSAYSSTMDKDVLLKGLSENSNRTFVDCLIDSINRKGLRDADVYKSAQLDRRLFSHMMSDRDYKPSKDTALAVVFALRLSLPEANDMLSRAGYALSHSNKRDIIIEFFLRERVHDLDDINEILYNLGQKTIGR